MTRNNQGNNIVGKVVISSILLALYISSIYHLFDLFSNSTTIDGNFYLRLFLVGLFIICSASAFIMFLGFGNINNSNYKNG